MRHQKFWDNFELPQNYYILELRGVFLCCWRICLVCLVLELVGPWVELGFDVGMKALDGLLLLNVP